MVGRRAWIALVSLALVGCGPAQPTASGPVMVPTPTFMCTPEAGGPTSPCTEREYREMQERDAQYAQAEDVYRKYLAEYVRLMRAGGAKDLSPVLKELLGDATLAKNTLAQLRELKSEGLRVVGADPNISSVVRNPSQTMEGSTVTLEFCVDARSLTFYHGKARRNRLGISRETIFFRGDGPSKLVIVAGTFKVVDSCDEQ